MLAPTQRFNSNHLYVHVYAYKYTLGSRDAQAGHCDVMSELVSFKQPYLASTRSTARWKTLPQHSRADLFYNLVRRLWVWSWLGH